MTVDEAKAVQSALDKLYILARAKDGGAAVPEDVQTAYHQASTILANEGEGPRTAPSPTSLARAEGIVPLAWATHQQWFGWHP